MKRLTHVALAATALLLTVQSGAVTLIGNYPIANNTTLSAGLTNLRLKAMGFTTPNEEHILKTITLHLNSTSAGNMPIVSIWDAVQGGTLGFVPNAVQHTLLNPVMGNGMADYVFSANGAFNFMPNTLYFLHVSGPAGVPAFDWRASVNAAQTPTGLATHFGGGSGGLFTTNGGTSWTTSASFNFYQIETNVVPEPATFAVVGAALFGLLLRRRR